MFILAKPQIIFFGFFILKKIKNIVEFYSWRITQRLAWQKRVTDYL
jgi:hypothetical protein